MVEGKKKKWNKPRKPGGTSAGVIQEAHHRRKIIREIIRERGFKNIAELQKILKDDYNIDVSTQTLYMDRRKSTLGSGELEEIDVALSAYVQKLINHLDKIIRNSDNEKNRISAIRTAANVVDKKHAMAVRMAGFEEFKQSSVVDKKKKENINIRFFDSDGDDGDGEKT
jgi:hypothetical protein